MKYGLGDSSPFQFATLRAVLVYTMPFWVLKFAWMVLHERLSCWPGLTVAVALCGLVILIQPWRFTGELLASVLAVGAGMSWDASMIYVKRPQNAGRSRWSGNAGHACDRRVSRVAAVRRTPIAGSKRAAWPWSVPRWQCSPGIRSSPGATAEHPASGTDYGCPS